MSLLNDLARGLSGANKPKNTGYTSRPSSANSRPKTLYQCRYCGRREYVDDPRFLPHGGTGCRARGQDRFGRYNDHVWEKL